MKKPKCSRISEFKLPHDTLDLTIVDNKNKVWIVGIVPGDSRMEGKEQEKIRKYKDLQIEMEGMWLKDQGYYQ